MLLDEDPAALIAQCIQNCHIDPDRASLSRITHSLSTLHQSRDQLFSSERSINKQLTRQLASLAQHHNLTLQAHNPTEHASSILKLDGEKFRVAKEASDLEIEGERLESEVAAAEAQLKELERRGLEGWESDEGVGGESQDVLRLKVYRSLGIDVERDGKGAARKAVIRSLGRSSAAVVDVNGGRKCTEEVWGAL